MLAFIDFETRSLADLRAVGAYSYAHRWSTDVTVLGYSLGDSEVRAWSPDWAVARDADAPPDDLLDHVREGGGVVAWNAFFDRHIWNAVMVPKYGWPPLKLSQVYCAQAQAEGSNLPGGLAKACEALGTTHKKDPHGARLIQILCVGSRGSWDVKRFDTPEMLGHFREYCRYDVMSMREIWSHTRPFTAREWAEYHASERINDRGVAVDVAFAQHAQRYAFDEANNVNERMEALTGTKSITITAHLRKARYLHDELWPCPELQALVTRPAKDDGKPRFSCDRPTRETISELLTTPEYADQFDAAHLTRILAFIELIEAGNSAAVYKYKAIARNAYQGRVHGAYAFSGAGQTGRFASRGIQIHNMIRTPLDEDNADRALDAIDDICAGYPVQALTDAYGLPISRLLARLLRPTFIAEPDRVLVWGDWAQIEARVLPWLSDSQGGDDVLDVFARGDDVYVAAAAGMFRVPMDQVDKDQRQLGKVATLALGFGGGVGAFSAMGRAYGVLLPEEETRGIVTAWREANGWCVEFWRELWRAALAAHSTPGKWFGAGMVRYLYHPNVMHGTLFCELPSGRWLTYPQFKYGKALVKNASGEENLRDVASFSKAFGGSAARVTMWHGTLAENITQAVAADLLRHTLVDCDTAVLHTHDEVVLEVPESESAYYKCWLRDRMLTIPDWAEDLPLEVDIESGPFYTK